MNFRKVSIEDKYEYDKFYKASNIINDNYIASELNFSNLFCWNVSDNILLHFGENAIFSQAVFNGEVRFLPPLVKDVKYFTQSIIEICDYAKKNNIPLVIRSLTNEMIEVLKSDTKTYDMFNVVYNRDYSEYLYSPNDLIELVGKKFNQKRNHLNYFKNNFEYEYRPFKKEDKQCIINLVHQWKVATGSSDSIEEIAIDNALAHINELELECGVILIDSKIIASTIGFINKNNCAVVMFEKALMDYRGSYQAINNFFVSNNLKNAKLINRQEDMGMEGLRKAKMSYNPIGFVDKYDLRLKEA